LLQEEGTDDATVAGFLGHTSKKFVQTTYKRYKDSNGVAAIQKLPNLAKKAVEESLTV
jgi:integrase